jgi:glutamate-1-semialdehyde 2,1-aminomutase
VATLEKQSQQLAFRLRRTKPAMQNLIAILRNKLELTDRESLRAGLAKAVQGWDGPDAFEDSESTRRAADYVERGRRVLAAPSYPGTLAVHHARGIYPYYSERSIGAYFHDASGRKYLDWYMSGGAVALGHNNPVVCEAIREQIGRGINLSQPATLEIEVAEQLCALIPTAEMAAFGKNGTDVTSAAIKLARIVTGREHLVMCGYHGFQDWSWAAEPGSAGIPAAYRELVHPFPFNDLAAATAVMERQGTQVAAIVIEPVREADADPGFLRGLRALADRHGALLIFDEVVTGFRTARGGVQEVTGVRPDLTCLAKSIANGMPLAALVGARRWMRHMPEANFGMTYRWDGLSLAAARATLDVFRETDASGHLRKIGELMRDGFAQAAQRTGLDWRLSAHPALLYFRIEGGGRLTQRGAEDLFAQVCLRNGIFIRIPRILPSLAHTEADVERTMVVIEDAMRTVRQAMDHGLEGHFDGPIWSDLQHPAPPEKSPGRPMHYRSETIPFPFQAVPSRFQPSALNLTVNAPDESSSATVDNTEVLLRIGRWSHGAPATCCADISEPLANPAVIEARYAIDEMPRNSAYVIVQLCVTDAAGEQIIVSHDLVFGGQATSRAQAGGGQRSLPCPYGVAGGTFRLEFVNGRVRIAHETEWADDLGDYRFKPSGPVRLSFRLYGSLEGGPAQVRLLDLSVGLSATQLAASKLRRRVRKLAGLVRHGKLR